MKTFNIISIASLAAFAASGLAAEKTHSHSSTLVSPAQGYNLETNKPEVSFGFGSVGSTRKVDGQKTDTDATFIQSRISGLYQVPRTGLKLGLTGNFDSAELEDKRDGDKTADDATELTLTPTGIYTFNSNVSAAVSVDYNQVELDGDSIKSTYSTLQYTPAVVVTLDNVEFGLAYTTGIAQDEEFENSEGVTTDREVFAPAVTTLHGKVAANKRLSLGGSIGFAQTSDETVSEEVSKNTDQYRLKAMAQVKATNNLTVDSVLSYDTAYYGKDNLQAASIGQTGIDVGADYAFQNASLGAGIAYKTGSGREDNVEVTTAQVVTTIRGSVKF